MVKKLIFYLILFIFLATINLFLSIKALAYFEKQSLIEKMIADIDQKKNNFYSSYIVNSKKTVKTEATIADGRVANLKAFFRKYNSPLYDYAEKIVEVSDKYQFDYRLLPAIAMQESNLCRVIPENSYNCWGWGIYGSLVTRFSSYEEAIETVAKGLKTEYIDKGLITASMIMKKYTPPSKGSWAHGVNTFLRALE
ncbi:MAG: hypothetical protein KatS3mg092_0833 [Patescibacteria group bacterium]|nr:MAG: hypothetical protein KatS3mg092_0833 [Patescibacteria group bacterium]